MCTAYPPKDNDMMTRPYRQGHDDVRIDPTMCDGQQQQQQQQQSCINGSTVKLSSSLLCMPVPASTLRPTTLSAMPHVPWR
mmetsp:Transcript_21919/g.55790  ORF Transcript_21919/g.55790 Transcript_21919/m.55790 type:complete len:81 (-) Transcript_21919:348-590(-)